MTEQLGIFPWYRNDQPPQDLPEMEPLQPNPNYRPQPAPTVKRRQPTTHEGRAYKGPSKAALRAQSRSQPRDEEGRFAEKGGWFKQRWNAWLEPTPRPPTRLKRPVRTEARSFREIRTAAPPRKKTKKRKKSVPERSMLGRVIAFFNGDYAKWRMSDLRQRARLRAQIDGYGLPKKRKRRRRKTRSSAHVRPPRRGGFLRRILSL